MFGDSWAVGSELKSNEKPFGQLVAEKLNLIEFNNYAQIGSSVTHLILQLKDFVKNKNNLNEYLAIFLLTGKERHLSWSDNNWVFHTVHGTYQNGKPADSTLEEITKLYYKYFYSDQLTDLQINTALVTLQSICQQYGIHDFYIPGWQRFNLWPEVNSIKVYKQGQVACGDMFELLVPDPTNYQIDSSNPYIYPNRRHPNQLGHQLIADQLIKWIGCA